MKKYLSLVKLLFAQQYRTKPSTDKRKKGGTIALFIILPLCFLPMLIGFATAMYYLGKISQGENLVNICASLLLLCQGVVFIFGVPSLMSNVFSAKDADKLLFLPIRSTTIFSAKLTVVYLNEVITTAVMLIATLLPFGIGLSAGVGFYLLLILALVLVPLLPLLFASIFAIPLSALIAKFSKNGVVKTVLQLLMFIVIMAIYLFAMYELGFMGGEMGDDVEKMEIAEMLRSKFEAMGRYMKYVHSNFTLASAMVGVTVGAVLLNLLISFAENILLLILVLLMAVPFYRWILLTSTEGEGGDARKKANKVNKDELQVKNNGVVRELIFSDIKRVTRDGQMGFQSILSLVILPIMVVVFAIIFGAEGTFDDVYVEPMYQIIAPIVFVAYMSLLGMVSNVLGIYPISRENKSIYLIKSLPISFGKYLLAKVILATSAMLISDFVTCVMIVILFKIQWYYGIVMLVTMALMGFGTMCITTLIDLKTPKLGWTNFNQSLKNAKNSWIASLIALICMIVIAVVATLCILGWYFTNGGWYMLMIMWLLIVGLSAGYAVVSYKIMASKAQKYFDNIEP